jgi:hypothetical protein
MRVRHVNMINMPPMLGLKMIMLVPNITKERLGSIVPRVMNIVALHVVPMAISPSRMFQQTRRITLDVFLALLTAMVLAPP